MTEPVRLLEAPRSGLERDLLRSALGEVAPDAVRARVVAVSLAVSSEEVSSDGVLAGSSSESSAELPSAGTRRVLAPRSLHALYLSGALAVAAGAGVLLLRGALRDSMQPAARPPIAHLESGADAPALTRRTPARAAQSASVRAEQGTLANTSSEVPYSRVTPSTSQASHGALQPGLAAAEREGAALAREAQETDWLGAQLRLLGQARELLESGRLDQAGSLLDGYEQQFPGGLIGPQILRLRAELRERRSSSSVPR